MSKARGIDHLVLAVRDLDAAAKTYEALGFTLTPRAQHPFGTANRLVQLQGCFVELLEVDRPELIGPSQQLPSFAEYNRDFLARREGLSMLVLESENAMATRAELSAAGLKPRPIVSFEREAEQPDGTTATVGFDLVTVDFNAAAVGFFTCAQRRPDLFWKPEYQDHPNGARTIRLLDMQSPRQARMEDFLARFTGVRPTVSQIASTFDTPRGRIALRADGRAPRFNGFIIEVPSLAPVRDAAKAAGIAFNERRFGIEFAPEVAHGVRMAFLAPDELPES